MQEIFQGVVRDLSSEGLGVVDHPEGRVFFVRGTWPGDQGEFGVLKLEKRYGFAELKKLTVPSPKRVQPPCPHQGFQAGQCGGCPWMIASYEDQLRQKQKVLENTLVRRKLMSKDLRILSIKSSPQNLGYRNRAQLKTNGDQIGFVSADSKVLAPIEDCLVLSPFNRTLLKELKTQLPHKDWRPGPGFLWSFLEIDEGLSEASQVQVNKRRPFRQANNEQNEYMKNWLKEKLSTLPKEEIMELFCGSGNFTEVIAQFNYKKIYAAESVGSAIENLAQKNLPKVTTFVADLDRPSQWKALKQEARKVEILVLDPPRTGFQLINEFLDHFKNLKDIFYISCAIHQWASEAVQLKENGWILQEVQPVDQFPHTPHIELLSHFRRE